MSKYDALFTNTILLFQANQNYNDSIENGAI